MLKWSGAIFGMSHLDSKTTRGGQNLGFGIISVLIGWVGLTFFQKTPRFWTFHFCHLLRLAKSGGPLLRTYFRLLPPCRPRVLYTRVLKNRIARNLSIAKKISPECVVPLLFSRRVLPSSSVHSDAKRKGAPSRPATTEARTGNALQGALESENGSI